MVYKFKALVRALHDAGVEFIVVGGLAATLNGVPVTTFDADVVHRRTPENIDRLLPVLDGLHATRPGRPALLSTGHQNLTTKYGPLDLLGSIGEGLSYEELLPRSTEILIGNGVPVRVLDLETLIEMKEQLSGEKDRAMLPILRRTLEEHTRKR